MYISLNWLKDFVDIKEKDPQKLSDLFTQKTAEVEGFKDQSEQFDKMVVGQVIQVEQHPNADKLKITKTSIGEKEDLNIICGGENLKEGMYVAVAKLDALVKWHGEGEKVKIERVKIRGIESIGMICAGTEIGLGDLDSGPHDILDLSPLKPKVGQPLAELFKKNDIILEFDNKTLTHRPDLWGHYGIARELATLTGQKFKELKPDVKIPKSGDSIKVTVENKKLCLRYCGLIIENIEVKESPQWLKQRLQATGHGTHNNIVDITNYVMTELGQPMHAFDKGYIKDGIVVRSAKDGEKITTLDQKTYKLDETNLVIADSQKAVAVAGVIGGERSGINDKTTTIILESATFNAESVRRTSTSIGVRTDSVQRFEKSLDPHLAELAIKRAAELILQVCPSAKISGPITDIKNFDEKDKETTLSIKKACSKIGVEIEKKEIIDILTKLEFKIKEKNADTLVVTIPSFRGTKDIDIEDDLIEEIARIYGYEKIPTTLPKLPAKLPIPNVERTFKHKAREILSLGLGLDEVYNYSFYGKKDLDNCLMSEDAHLKLLNYLSEEQTHLRVTLIPNILKNIQLNIKNFDEFGIYEIGHSYKEIGQLFPLEEKKIAGAIVKKGNTTDPFYEAKGAVETIFERFAITGIKAVKEIKNAPYAHPNKAITYIAKNGETIAHVFSPHPLVTKNHSLDKYSIGLFELNFTELMKLASKKNIYKAISKFPTIEFDISVLIDKNTEIQTIKESINKANKELISNIQLFDIYEGQGIEDTKKAVAFKITLQSNDRTLTDQEMAETQDKVFKNLEKMGGEIRGK